MAPDGRNYLVTNRHVVVDASSADIESESADGAKKAYKACPVVAVDDELDLALLAFPPDERPFKAGLPFADEALSDGEEVWSAGYPGLGDRPAWQFGKGAITNASARVEELVDPELSTLIQHSAQVDPEIQEAPFWSPPRRLRTATRSPA